MLVTVEACKIRQSLLYARGMDMTEYTRIVPVAAASLATGMFLGDDPSLRPVPGHGAYECQAI